MFTNSYPCDLPTHFVATVRDVSSVTFLRREKATTKISFLSEDTFHDVCIFVDMKQLKQLCHWANVNSKENLLNKKFGIEIHEEFGYVTDIYKDDFSEGFSVF